VTRYREDVAKVALVNPDDLAMLEQAHELVDALGALEREPLSATTFKALRAEDRPGPRQAPVELPQADKLIAAARRGSRCWTNASPRPGFGARRYTPVLGPTPRRRDQAGAITFKSPISA